MFCLSCADNDTDGMLAAGAENGYLAVQMDGN